jgi:hypothetical protein
MALLARVAELVGWEAMLPPVPHAAAHRNPLQSVLNHLEGALTLEQLADSAAYYGASPLLLMNWQHIALPAQLRLIITPTGIRHIKALCERQGQPMPEHQPFLMQGARLDGLQIRSDAHQLGGVQLALRDCVARDMRIEGNGHRLLVQGGDLSGLDASGAHALYIHMEKTQVGQGIKGQPASFERTTFAPDSVMRSVKFCASFRGAMLGNIDFSYSHFAEVGHV